MAVSGDLVGRRTELSQLIRVLTEDTGIGKTNGRQTWTRVANYWRSGLLKVQRLGDALVTEDRVGSAVRASLPEARGTARWLALTAAPRVAR